MSLVCQKSYGDEFFGKFVMKFSNAWLSADGRCVKRNFFSISHESINENWLKEIDSLTKEATKKIVKQKMDKNSVLNWIIVMWEMKMHNDEEQRMNK